MDNWKEFECKGKKYGCEESFDDQGYFYRIPVLLEDEGKKPKRAFLIITENGVSFDMQDGSCFRTEFVPNLVFGELSSLEEKHLAFIIEKLEEQDVEDWTFVSSDEMSDLYDEYLKSQEGFQDEPKTV